MIVVHRLNGKEFVINCEMIKSVEATPDTLVALVGGEKIMVKETIDEIIKATIDFKRQVFQFPKT